MTRVIVIGGGIGGLSAAHELAERGFDVHVYEARRRWGGKARSQWVAGTGTDGRRDLPGEHGFRFYPRFYTHVIDTMSRITLAIRRDGRRSTPADTRGGDRDDRQRNRRTVPPRRHQDAPSDIIESLNALFRDMGFDGPDLGLFGDADLPLSLILRRTAPRRIRKDLVVDVPRRRRLLAAGASSSSRTFHACSSRWTRRAATPAPTATSRCSCCSISRCTPSRPTARWVDRPR